MTVETQGDTLSSLDPEYPRHNDPRHQGDDHLRLIKQTLQSQFPGSAGSGFADVITAVEAEINALSGLNTDETLETRLQTIEDDLATGLADLANELSAPIGTRMVFHQTTPPLGWIQDETNDDCMLRIVGSIGGGGAPLAGVDSPILNDKVPSHTHEVIEAGLHSHEYDTYSTSGPAAGEIPSSGPITWNTETTATDGLHTHSISINDPAANWAPKYLDTIIAVRAE